MFMGVERGREQILWGGGGGQHTVGMLSMLCIAHTACTCLSAYMLTTKHLPSALCELAVLVPQHLVTGCALLAFRIWPSASHQRS